jgi:hypothetical protein
MNNCSLVEILALGHEKLQLEDLQLGGNFCFMP